MRGHKGKGSSPPDRVNTGSVPQERTSRKIAWLLMAGKKTHVYTCVRSANQRAKTDKEAPRTDEEKKERLRGLDCDPSRQRGCRRCREKADKRIAQISILVRHQNSLGGTDGT